MSGLVGYDGPRSPINIPIPQITQLNLCAAPLSSLDEAVVRAITCVSEDDAAHLADHLIDLRRDELRAQERIADRLIDLKRDRIRAEERVFDRLVDLEHERLRAHERITGRLIDLECRKLKTQETVAALATNASVARDLASSCIAWLNTRRPGEIGFETDYAGEVSSRSFSGVRVYCRARMKTRIIKE